MKKKYKVIYESIDRKYRRALREGMGDKVVYMNTWKNYNEYGADLEDSYGITDGWMTVDEAREFADKYAEDEPFINDTDIGFDLGIDEYSNVDDSLDQIEKVMEMDDNDKEIVEAIVDCEGCSVDEAIDIYDRGDYEWYSGITDYTDLAYEIIDELGGIGEALGDRASAYIDWQQFADAIEDDERNAMYDDLTYDKSEVAEANGVEEDEVTEDMIQDYIDENIQDRIDSVVDEYDYMVANGEDVGEDFIEQYFDYEKFGRDLSYDGYYITDKGIIRVTY